MKIKLEMRCKGRIMALVLYFWKKVGGYIVCYRTQNKKKEGGN